MHFLTMNADESADCAGRWEGRLPTGLCFYFFPGPRTRKMHLQKLGFRLGSDLVMLSVAAWRRHRFFKKSSTVSLKLWYWRDRGPGTGIINWTVTARLIIFGSYINHSSWQGWAWRDSISPSPCFSDSRSSEWESKALYNSIVWRVRNTRAFVRR